MPTRGILCASAASGTLRTLALMVWRNWRRLIMGPLIIAAVSIRPRRDARGIAQEEALVAQGMLSLI